MSLKDMFNDVKEHLLKQMTFKVMEGDEVSLKAEGFKYIVAGVAIVREVEYYYLTYNNVYQCTVVKNDIYWNFTASKRRWQMMSDIIKKGRNL